MRFPFLPRPSRTQLASTPLQVIVRDYPETLVNLREHGMSPRDHGDEILIDLDESGAVLDELELATAWRPGPAPA